MRNTDGLAVASQTLSSQLSSMEWGGEKEKGLPSHGGRFAPNVFLEPSEAGEATVLIVNTLLIKLSVR